MLSLLKNRNARAAAISHGQLQDLQFPHTLCFSENIVYEHQKTSSDVLRQKIHIKH
ncbi:MULTISPECIES: hypothetical protein [unclassified Pseudomonas]|uniref:hypothetical protein n=1 Tax=unclassified Pseudomonas TaxID=196821 RepID=UPI001CC0378B|nr:MULTISPECIES: hypothetical protein [unclassified Pseudomonas]